MSDIVVYDDENPISSEFFLSMKQFIPVEVEVLFDLQSFESEAFKNKWIIAIPLKHTIEQEKLSKQFIRINYFCHLR